MIVTEKEQLKQICEPCSSIEEGEEIATKLLKELTKSKRGIGLAANQIGINKRVCVINVTEPIVLINPKILGLNDTIFTTEGCLSFPNKQVKTKRSQYVTIDTDNLGKVMFGPSEHLNGEKRDLQLLESICVQHEIDHLDGITMYERAYQRQPIVNESKKIGRNEKVTIHHPQGETLTIKYKKFDKYKEMGWLLS